MTKTTHIRTSQMMLLPTRSVRPSIRLDSFNRLFTQYPSFKGWKDGSFGPDFLLLFFSPGGGLGHRIRTGHGIVLAPTEASDYGTSFDLREHLYNAKTMPEKR